MKYIIALLVVLFFCISCKKYNDPGYKNILEVYNITDKPLKIKFFNGLSIDSFLIDKNYYTITYNAIGSATSPFTGTDSILIEFVNGRTKVDRNCYKLIDIEASDCIRDSISLYNINRYLISNIENGEIDRYYISSLDSLEAK